MRNHVLTSHFHDWISKLIANTKETVLGLLLYVKGTVLCIACYILLNSYLTRQIKCSADYATKKNNAPTLVSPLKRVCVETMLTLKFPLGLGKWST